MARTVHQTDFVLNAEDRTQAAFRSLQASMTGVIDSINNMRGMIATLGAGAFATMITGAIDAMDKLNDLSKSTGLTVETLSGLRMAAKQSGTDLDGLANAINKLSVNIGKDGERFQQLGITVKDPLEAFKQLADVFSKIQDPQLRAALGAEALGKSWASAAPLLAEGGEKIGEMVEEGTRLSGVTSEAARQADEFNDKLVKLVGTGGLVNSAVSPLLPLLNKLADDMLTARDNASSLSTGFSALLETAKAVTVVFGNVGYVLKAMGLEIGAWAAQLMLASRAFAQMKFGDFNGAAESMRQFAAVGKAASADAESNRAAFDKWEAEILAIGTASTATTPAVKELSDAEKAAAKSAADAARAFVDKGNAAEKGIKPIRDLALANEHVTAWLKHLASEEKRLIELMDHRTKLMRNMQRAEIEEIDARDEVLDRLEDGNAMLEIENATLGMTERMRQLYIMALREEKDIKTALTPKDEERIRALYDEQRALLATQETMVKQASVWNDLADRGARFFTDLLFNGRDAFRRLGQELKAFAAELVALFAKKWILQMIAGVTGNASLSAMANSAGSGSMAGSFIGNGVTASTGIGSAIYAGGSEFVAGATGSFMGPIAPGSAAAMGQNFAAFMTNPATLAVMAVVAAVLIARSRQGGPKEGGAFYGSYDASGNLIGDVTGGFRRMTPTSGDSIMQSAGAAIADGYFATLARWGGSTNGITFGTEFDKDPRGSADSRVIGRVLGVGGQSLFDQMITAGRDDADFERATGLMARRQILVALQNSTLPEGIKAVLGLIDAASATAEDIDAIFALADAFSNLLEALAPIDAGSVIADASRTATESLAMQGDALLELANRSTITTESLQQLTQSAGAFRQAAAQMIAQLEAVKRSMAAMFASTYQEIMLSGMSPDQQYAYWQGQAENARGLLATATDPAEIERLGRLINEAIGNAWGLLGEGQQAALREQFLAGITDIDQYIAGRIGSVQQSTAEQANTILTQVETVMTAAAVSFQRAADTMNSAADRIEAAAGETGTVVVRVEDGRVTGIVTDSGG